MKKHWFRRLVPLSLLLALLTLFVQPFSVVSADTIVSDEVIYPDDPELVDVLKFNIPSTEIIGSASIAEDSSYFYFYSFDEFDSYDPLFSKMVDYHNQGYFLGTFGNPSPAFTLTDDNGNTAVLWLIPVNESFLPVMLIGEAGLYSFVLHDVDYGEYSGDLTLCLELPGDGVAVADVFVDWDVRFDEVGWVQVYRDLATQKGIVSAIAEIWTAVASWFISTMGLVPSLFYVEETGLTFIGTLAIFGGGLSVIIGIIYAVRSWLKSR